MSVTYVFSQYFCELQSLNSLYDLLYKKQTIYFFILIVPNIFEYIRLVSSALRQRIVSLNLFESRGPHTPESVYRERITTRLFIFLLAVSGAGFGFYTFVSVQTQILTITDPSLNNHLDLYRHPQHSTSLQCPCSQFSVPYKKFLNVTFVLHQVCSSEFISPTWLNYVALFDPPLLDRSDGILVVDFRVVTKSYFQLLNISCSLAKITIEDALHTFVATEFVNGRLRSPLLFAQETQSLIDSFINTTSRDFKLTLNWIKIASQANQLVTGTDINSYIVVDSYGNVNILDPLLYYFDELTETTTSSQYRCFCARDGQLCSLASYIDFNTSDCSPCEHVFIGMTAGRVPLAGFLQSTITWLYNSTYIEEIRSTYAIAVPSKYSPPILKPLNASVQTRFKNVELSELVNEMLLETWIINNSHFDRFYNECAPISCTYIIEERRSM